MRLKRWQQVLLVMVGVFTGAVSVSAQSEDDIWFWAWRPYDLKVEKAEDQRGDVLAFLPDGTNNVLLEDVFPIVLTRMDETHAFVGAKHEDVYHLYYLTPTEAIDVMPLFDQAYMDELAGYTWTGGYAFYMPQIVPAGEGHYLIADTKQDLYGLFDMATNSTTSLDLRSWCEEDCVRVSEDGRYIRYRVPPKNPLNPPFFDTDPFALPYQIYEYDIVTQTERLIFEKPATNESNKTILGHAQCTPDQYGERWYCELFLNDSGNGVWADEQWIVSEDGMTQPVDPAWQLRVFDHEWYFLEFENECSDCPIPEPSQADGAVQDVMLVSETGSFDDECNPCAIKVFPDGDQERVFEFNIPYHNTFRIDYERMQLLSEQHLLLPTSFDDLALSRSGDVTLLGERACCADPGGFDSYSADAGWLIAINQADRKNPTTELWRTRPFEHVASLPWSQVAIPYPSTGGDTFKDYSVVLLNEGPGGRPVFAYSYIDDVSYEFDFEGVRMYIDAFPGGILMVDYGDTWPEGTFAEANDGISRWTPEEGETRLLDGVTQIPDY